MAKKIKKSAPSSKKKPAHKVVKKIIAKNKSKPALKVKEVAPKVDKKTAAPRLKAVDPIAAPLNAVPLAPPTPSEPSRAPMRKIIGPGNTLVIVPKAQPVATEAALPVEEKSVEEKIVEIIPEPIQEPKVSWQSLPRSLPPQIAFLVKAAEKECHSAASSPFPFAKFISSLPEAMCGKEFGLLILSLDHDNDSIARLCDVDLERVRAILVNARLHLNEAFDAACPQMSRKWRTQLGGPGRKVESLLEQFLVPQVDRHFQAMVGSLILKAMLETTLVASNAI